MGKAFEVIGGQVTAPAGTLTALVMNAGDSATVKNASLSSFVGLLQTWTRNNVTGIWRIRSPKLHDNVQGLRFRAIANDPSPLITVGTVQRLVPQDNLILELSGSAVGGEIEQAFLLNYYVDLPGQQARLIGRAELLKRTQNIVTNEVLVTPGVLGSWSGAIALNSVFDLLKANTDYALVGYLVDQQCGAVGFKGPDTSNLRVGGPGLVTAAPSGATGRHITTRWFETLSEEFNLALIPVINSANKAATTVDIAQDDEGVAVNVTAILHELSPPGQDGFSVGIQ
jgi:hypothetical protein